MKTGLALAAAACAAQGALAFVPATPLATKASSPATVRMMAGDDRSIALPFDKRPANLDGSMVGDVGFDPAGFSNNPPRPWLIGGSGSSLKWYREAEIVHGRVAMLAALGWFFPETFFHWPGNDAVGMGAFAEVNPLKAWGTVPKGGLQQIIVAASIVEHFRIARVFQGGAEPGDLGLGQGEGRFNPFGFNYSEEEYRAKQLQEIKHGRLAMLAIVGMYAQANVTGVSLGTQLGGAFSFPEAVGKAADAFPAGL